MLRSQNLQPNFFWKLKIIGNENIIIAGDWNVALNDKLDTFRYRGVSRPNAKRKILDKMLLLNLIDVWREFNPFMRQYTWRKFNSTKQGRIDFFLITKSLASCIDSKNILPGYRSDHSLIILTFNGKTYERGKYFWKFNNSLLNDEEYIKTVKTIKIQKTIKNP